MSRTPADTVALLLFRIETAARHGKLAEMGFGLEWVEVADVMNAHGHVAANKDPVALDGERVDFDVSLLERSNRSRTGFAGVYATGSSWRALVPDVENGGSRYLQSRPTAVRAAIDRYEHFEKYGIPYGNLGRFVEETLNRHSWKTVEQALIEARGFVDKGLKHSFTGEQLEATIRRYRQLNGLPDEFNFDLPDEPEETAATPAPEAPKPKRDRPRAPAPPPEVTVQTTCVACDEVVSDGQRYRTFGSGSVVTLAHEGCVDLITGEPYSKSIIARMKSKHPASCACFECKLARGEV